MATYSGDPRWIPARYPGKCIKCNEAFTKGRMIFYYPNTKHSLVGKCAIDAADLFDAAKQDEEFMCS